MRAPEAGVVGRPAIGALLRRWRGARSLSQLDLALDADVSSRHLSFVETGRAQPSREMVLRLAEALEVPLRDRNALLLAAGFAPLYRETGLTEPDLSQARRALDFILQKHEPYPAVVVDRRWDLLLSNAAAARFLSLFACGPSDERPNAVRMLLHPQGLRPFVVNWEEAAGALVHRLRRDLALVPDEAGSALLEEVLGYPGVPRRWAGAGLEAPATPLLPVVFRKDALELRLFSTIATFGTAQDVTLQELRIECFFPADADTERMLASAAGHTPGP